MTHELEDCMYGVSHSLDSGLSVIQLLIIFLF